MTPVESVAIAQSIVGERETITRAEMRAILTALGHAGLSLVNGYVRDTLDTTVRYQTAPWHPPAPIEQAAAAWERMCHGIQVISVCAIGDIAGDGYVRYDQPGSMHPMQMADVTFVWAGIDDRSPDIDSIGHIRKHHAELVLVVED